MLNTFIKNYNYSKAKVNNILHIIYKNDLGLCDRRNPQVKAKRGFT